MKEVCVMQMKTRIMLAVALYVLLSVADVISAGSVEWGWNLLMTAVAMVLSWFVIEIVPSSNRQAP